MAKRWRSFLKMEPGNLKKQLQPPQPEETSSVIYLSINDLPLSKFIDVAVNGDLKALITSGNPSQAELMEAWAEIQAQYGEAMGNGRQRMSINLYKQIAKIEVTLAQIETCIKVLKPTYVKQFADLLNELLSTNFSFDVRFPEDYDRDLKRAHNRSKGLKIDLDLKNLQYESLQNEKDGKGEKSTREGFITTLIVLSDHAHFPISTEISVFEFCTRIKRFNAWCEAAS